MEELKQILITLSTMGELGKDMFIWWLVMDKLVYVISWLITLTLLMVGVKYILDTVTFWESNEKTLREIRDMLKVGSAGTVTQSEIIEMKNKVAELMEAHRKNL